MIKFIYIFSKAGKPRIVRYYDNPPEPLRLVTQNDVSRICLAHSKQVQIVLFIGYDIFCY